MKTVRTKELLKNRLHNKITKNIKQYIIKEETLGQEPVMGMKAQTSHTLQSMCVYGGTENIP